MKIDTSLIRLDEAVKEGRTLNEGDSVILPIGLNAKIYGFIVTNEVEDLFNSSIDMPPLGEGCILSNRAIFKFGEKIYRFPIFTSVCNASEEKYCLYGLYIPKFLSLPQYKLRSYKISMFDKVPDLYVSKIDGVKLVEKKAYYYPQEDEMVFYSSSKLIGIGNDMAVVTRRLSKQSDNIKYEIFNSHEIFIEKKDSTVLQFHED